MDWLKWRLWDWPFFEDRHHQLAERVLAWVDSNQDEEDDELTSRCRKICRSLGESGLLEIVVPQAGKAFDVRSLCIIREGLTYDHALADAIFAMQGIGTLALQQHGTPGQKDRYLPGCRDGSRIAAFAVTEPAAGSDVASMSATAKRDGSDFVLNGDKTLISNAQFADQFLVVARTGEAPGARGLSAFIIDRDTPGLIIGESIEFIAEHPAGKIRFEECRISDRGLVGEAGQGFKVAMGAFDIFRPSVGAAGVGLARRAMGEAVERVGQRSLFGKPMADMQTIQMMLADMAADIDTAALAVYRAAWERDVRGNDSPYGPSLAKLLGSEGAGRVVDKAVQLCGGAGVTHGTLVERLYREARPMRIYEGATEVQKIIVGRAILKSLAAVGS